MALTRRSLLQLSGTSALAMALAPASLSGDARSMIQQGVIIDGLGFPGELSRADNAPLSASELSDLQHSGLTATHLTVGSVGSMPPLEAFESIVRNIAFWERQVDLYPDTLVRIRSARDILSAKVKDQTGLIYGLQDGVAFEDDPGRLDALHQLGVRIVQPTYNLRNSLGSGCMEDTDEGLSEAGRTVIERLHELRILVDLSHCGRQTTSDAINIAGGPVSFTHTGCDALVEHPRHRTDDEMRKAADSGGIIGIYVMPYLSRGKQPTAADVIMHLEHAIDVVGEDHVSVGTDGTISPAVLSDEYRRKFADITRKRKEQGIAAPYETEEGYLFANDLNTPERFETLAQQLLERGHGEGRVMKILGGNLLRAYRQVWG